MHDRSALILSLASLLGFAGQAMAQAISDPEDPAVPAWIVNNTDPNYDPKNPPPPLNTDPPVYQSFHAAPFGDETPCSICPTDVHQGALNDCSFLSALGAVSIASPGTLEGAIVDTLQQTQHGHDEIYNVRYFENFSFRNVYVSGTFPSIQQPNSKIFGGLFSVILPNLGRGYLTGLETPFFAFARPPSLNGWPPGVRAISWPLLMEKAFVKTLPNGYDNKNLYDNGVDPARTLEWITGLPSDPPYDIHKATTPENQVQSVWIHDSPALADRGGHSVIGGLLRFDLKSIEPNLKVCLAWTGAPHTRNCTGICRESHSCRQPLLVGLPLPAGQKVNVRILDVAGNNDVHLIADFDVDPTQCKDINHPCPQSVPAGPWVMAGTVTISFDVHQGSMSSLPALDSKLYQLYHNTEAIIAGTFHSQSECPAGDSICPQMFQPKGPFSWGHAYFLKKYVRVPYGSVANNQVVLGDPQGPEITVLLSQFYHAFLIIDSNKTSTVPSSCACPRP
ncbi:MAG TPA: hypothetical protein VGO37_07095 [Steroidobacteraceae bacterium]|jgi:hypothetical protein|nr:hypothetical protein [Steroidobacteraceae bacterium]